MALLIGASWPMAALIIFYAFTFFTISCRGQSISPELVARSHLDHTGHEAELEHLHQKRLIEGRNAWLKHFRRQLSDNATIAVVDSLMDGVGDANGTIALTASKGDHRTMGPAAKTEGLKVKPSGCTKSPDATAYVTVTRYSSPTHSRAVVLPSNLESAQPEATPVPSPDSRRGQDGALHTQPASKQNADKTSKGDISDSKAKHDTSKVNQKPKQTAKAQADKKKKNKKKKAGKLAIILRKFAARLAAARKAAKAAAKAAAERKKKEAASATAAGNKAKAQKEAEENAKQAAQAKADLTFQNQMVDEHNGWRKRYGANPLVYDAGLATRARDWAKKCIWEHPEGQPSNLDSSAMSNGQPRLTPKEVLDHWVNGPGEVSAWNPNNPVASHFTQVVWKSATRVACALNTCNLAIYDPSWWPVKYAGETAYQSGLAETRLMVASWLDYLLLVCFYDTGNVVGQYVQNVGALDS